MDNDPRYAPVEAALPETLPPINGVEALKAYKRILRHFGAVALGGPQQLRPIRSHRTEARRVWCSTKPTNGHHKGWGRLIHDASHTIFTRRHPTFRSHDGGHATLEREIAQYVVAKGWLAGTFKPKLKARLTADERRARRFERNEKSIARWQTKLKRATNALRSLKKRQRNIQRIVDRQLKEPI